MNYSPHSFPQTGEEKLVLDERLFLNPAFDNNASRFQEDGPAVDREVFEQQLHRIQYPHRKHKREMTVKGRGISDEVDNHLTPQGRDSQLKLWDLPKLNRGHSNGPIAQL